MSFESYKDELVVFSVEVVEMIAPQVFGISCVNKTVTVGSTLDEHMRRQIIEVPICGDFDQASVLTLDQWLHPLFGLLGVVDLGPGIIRPQIVRLTILMAHAVVVLDTI
jgi:hypothetical protein